MRRCSQWMLVFSMPAVLTLAVLAGCASGGDVTPRGGDAGPRDGIDAGETGVCDPPCADGEMCSAGTCVPSTDSDGDGLSSDIDCDDDDVAVGGFAERVCTGACGEGIETCTDGVWGACSAPTSCDCEPGAAPRTIECMHCGTQRQICADGTWTNDGVCTGAGPCSPGEIGTGGTCGNCGTERRVCGADCTWGAWACEGEGVCAIGATQQEMESCGTCGTGSRTRTRTCDATCAWGDYGTWGACTGGASGVCTPGETEMQTQACGNCGTQTRTRTCSATTCDWGPWSAFGSCSGEGVCAPGSTTACSPADACGQRVCSASCGWGSCQPVVAPSAGGCLHQNGTNSRACTLSGGGTGRQYCLPPIYGCVWSDQCA